MITIITAVGLVVSVLMGISLLLYGLALLISKYLPSKWKKKQPKIQNNLSPYRRPAEIEISENDRNEYDDEFASVITGKDQYLDNTMTSPKNPACLEDDSWFDLDSVQKKYRNTVSGLNCAPDNLFLTRKGTWINQINNKYFKVPPKEAKKWLHKHGFIKDVNELFGYDPDKEV